jgi:hypothetical protein
MPYRPPFLAEPVHGIAMVPRGSTFSSSGHWSLAASCAIVECCARTVGCRASRERSGARSRLRTGVAPGPTSLACAPREQAASPCRAGHAPRDPGREGRCRPGPRANFGPVAWEFKKFVFYFSFDFKLNSNFKNVYLNIRSSKNYEIGSAGFLIF